MGATPRDDVRFQVQRLESRRDVSLSSLKVDHAVGSRVRNWIWMLSRQ
jgi:hypothetical protein